MLVTTVSLYVAVGARIGNGAVDTNRRECGAGPFEDLMRNRMAVPSFHSISRCARVSLLPQCLQRSDSTSLKTCRRSLVGTISCTTVYHMDAISSDTQAACRFFHAYIHCVSGCSCFILIFRDSLVAAAIVCRVL